MTQPEGTTRRATWRVSGGAHSFHPLVLDELRRYDETDHKNVRRLTVLEKDVLDKAEIAEKVLASIPSEPPAVALYLPEQLKEAVFVGHVVTDLDSVAGAIGGAELFGGTAARASDVNSETQFALDLWGVETPAPIEDIIKDRPDAEICLVDHQQKSQMHPAINTENVVGVIDHHALQSKTIVTTKPIVVDIRPWGSMSTIIAHSFLSHSRIPSKPTAGMLLCAILSDTLNLQGPTTTEFDRLMVPILAEIAEVEDVQKLAQNQFKAKSKELATLSAVALVTGDQKSFSLDGPAFTGDVAFGVVETTDDEIILDRLDELLPELVLSKNDNGSSVIFLAIVNIVKLRSNLVLCGPYETSLAKTAFGGTMNADGTIMDLGSMVSRKSDFIPAVTKAVKDGWALPVQEKQPVAVDTGILQVDPMDPYGRAQRRGSVISGIPRRLTQHGLKDVSNLMSQYTFTD